MNLRNPPPPASHQPAPGLPSALQEAILGVYRGVEDEYPEHALMRAVAGTMPCYAAVLNAITLHPNRLVSWSSLRKSRIDNHHPAVQRHLHDHPAIDLFVAERWAAPLRLTDVASERDLDRNPFIAGYYRPGGLRHQITLSLGPTGPEYEPAVWVVGVNRLDGLAFSAEECQSLDLLRPHLTNALDLLRRRRRREAAWQAGAEAAAAAGCATLSIAPDGSLLPPAEAARPLLERWFGPNPGWPPALQRLWQEARVRATAPGRVRPLVLEGPEGASLQIRLAPVDGSGWWGVWLREVRPARDGEIRTRLGLTPRQGAVAAWIAAGKSNPEIALLLGSSPRTVEKHVEHLLARLGLENRAGIARAVQDLGT